MENSIELSIGAEVNYRLEHGGVIQKAQIKSIDDGVITLKTQSPPPAMRHGDSLIIHAKDTDYFTEISDIANGLITVRCAWAGKREYFRVDDVLAILVRRLSKDEQYRKSRVLSGFMYDLPPTIIEDKATSDISISPTLHRMLTDIDAKLNLILERLYLDGEGLLKAETVPVNVSGSGIGFLHKERFEAGDILEIKVVLSSYPTVGVLVYGKVVSVKDLKNGQFRVATYFIDIDDDVRNEILQYTMRRERELRRIG